MKTLDIIKREKPKILIVDDREQERDILSKLLSKFDAEIHTASSGQKALSLLLRHEFILVLLDIQMPIMDGLETASLMRMNRKTENIPIIFLTAYDKDELNMLQGYKVGAIDYLFKPINREILLAKVKTFLRAYAFEKQKEYEKILQELANKNEKLNLARKKAVAMMEEANAARKLAEKSKKRIAQQVEDLKRYNKELEQYAYVSTHDLRAPLINLNGLLNIFKRKGFVTAKNKPVVDRIFNSVERINTTLDDLIHVVAHTKMHGQNIEYIHLEAHTKELLLDLQHLITQNDATIKLKLKQPAYLHYNPGQLRSILQNLITNGIKYKSDKRKPIITVSSKNEGDKVCISVQDNGMGIEENKDEKVFGLFQRLTTQAEGKGMGLYITKSQVESLGGHINYESTYGKGTTFNVYLYDLKPEK